MRPHRLPPAATRGACVGDRYRGMLGTTGADRFSFHVVTPAFLAQNPEASWGHGYLLMPELSWTGVDRMLTRIVSGASAATGTHWFKSCNAIWRGSLTITNHMQAQMTNGWAHADTQQQFAASRSAVCAGGLRHWIA